MCLVRLGTWVLYCAFSEEKSYADERLLKSWYIFLKHTTMTSQDENTKASSSNERLEMEEMRERLTETGLWEHGMSSKDMLQLINMLNESANMHKNTQSQSSPESQPPEELIDSPPKSPVERHFDLPKKTYSSAAKIAKSPSEVVPPRRGSVEENTTPNSNDVSTPKETPSVPKQPRKDWEKKKRQKEKIEYEPFWN